MAQAADDTGHARPSPQYSDMSTVVLFGKNSDFKKMIGNIIIGNDIWNVQSFNGFTVEKNGTFKIVITPDFEESLDIHQEIIDLMALSHPDPSLFILAVDPEHSREEEVVAQIGKLQTMLGDHITGHLAVVTHNVEIYYSLQRLKERFNIRLVSASENLPGDCQRWYSDRQQFQFDYKHSRDLVMRRRRCLDTMSFRKDHPSQHGHVTAAGADPAHLSTSQSTCAAPANPAPVPGPGVLTSGWSTCRGNEDLFSIVLLGQTGTGKSASANTILTAGNKNLDLRTLFLSRLSASPVTTTCQAVIVKMLGKVIRLVDTPDFFDEQLDDPEAKIEECKRFCQPGRCVVLLVIQLGRFTESEVGILERLEDKLGWRIRHSTVVLLTHGEDFNGSVHRFISERTPLKQIVEACGYRCHMFRNSSRESRQVIELFKKIPDYNIIFPKLSNRRLSDCSFL